MSLHLLHLCEAFLPQPIGGAGRAAADLIQAMAEQGHRIDVITPVPPGEARRWTPWPGVTVFGLPVSDAPMPGRAVRQSMQALARHIDFEGVDIIHDNAGFLVPLLPLERALRNTISAAPFIAQLQIQWRPLLTVEAFPQDIIAARVAAQRRLAELADRVVFLSEDERAEGCESLGVPEAIAEIMPNPIRVTRYAHLTRPANDPPVIGLAGRLSARMKGADLALSALEALAPHHAFSLCLLGEAPADGAIPPGLCDRTQSTGWLGEPETAAALARLDLLLVPSRYEPFGLVAAEALAAGTPVIVSETGGLRDIVPAGMGVRVPLEAGARGWQDALAAWLQRDGKRREGVEALRARVRERYDAPVVAAKTLTLYAALRQAGKDAKAHGG